MRDRRAAPRPRLDTSARPEPHEDRGQPRGRTGDEARTARSPLRLRLGLAVFGFLVCAALALPWLTSARPPGGTRVPGWVLVGLAVVAAVDIGVVAVRLRRRRGGRRDRR